MKTFEFEDNSRKIILVIKEKYEDGSDCKCIVDLCIDNKVIAEEAKE